MTDWVRLWHDMPTDPKWRVVARKSGQPLPCVLAVFTLMLTNASGNAAERGVLQGWDNEDAGAALDIDAEAVASIYSAMQGKVLDGDRLTGWERRQPKREDNTAAERKAAWKARKDAERNDAERTGTHGNAPETDAETEADTENQESAAGAVPLYAFSGRVIRLKHSDLAKWQLAYPALDVPALLQSRDDWLSTEADTATRKKWFISTSNYLAGLQQKAATLAREPAWVSPC